MKNPGYVYAYRAVVPSMVAAMLVLFSYWTTQQVFPGKSLLNNVWQLTKPKGKRADYRKLLVEPCRH